MRSADFGFRTSYDRARSHTRGSPFAAPWLPETQAAPGCLRTFDLADTVARKVGVKGNDRVVSDVVLRLNSIYAGYTSRVLWD